MYTKTYKTIKGDILQVSTSGNGFFFEAASLTNEKDLELNRQPDSLNKQQTESLLNYWQARKILA